MKKAVIYARVSTKDQEREGYSIPAQLRMLRNYAQDSGFEVVQEFRESESAGKAGRKAFGEMINLLEADNTIKSIIVEKTDRLYRNLKDHVILDELDIELHFAKDRRIISKNSKPTDKFVHRIETAQARFYLDNLSEEVKKGQEQKAIQGKYPGGMLPLGYIRNPVSKDIAIDPDRGPIIRRLFEMYSEGECSIDDLHEYVKSSRLTYLRSGRVIARSEIERILKKPFYTGKFQWHKDIYQGDHPAIVDSILFEKVQEVFRARSNGRFSMKNFTFSRLIQCGHCGNLITAEIKKGKYTYYHCTGYGKKHKISYVSEKNIDDQFAAIVSKATLPYSWYDFLKYNLESEFRNKKISIARERDRLESFKVKIKNDMKKAFQEKINGTIDDDFFKSIFSEYQEQLRSVENRLANLGDTFSGNYDLAQKAIELSYQAGSLYLKANTNQKRRLLKSLLSNCLLNDANLYPIYRAPFDILVNGMESNQKRRR